MHTMLINKPLESLSLFSCLLHSCLGLLFPSEQRTVPLLIQPQEALAGFFCLLWSTGTTTSKADGHCQTKGIALGGPNCFISLSMSVSFFSWSKELGALDLFPKGLVVEDSHLTIPQILSNLTIDGCPPSKGWCASVRHNIHYKLKRSLNRSHQLVNCDSYWENIFSLFLSVRLLVRH